MVVQQLDVDVSYLALKGRFLCLERGIDFIIYCLKQGIFTWRNDNHTR